MVADFDSRLSRMHHNKSTRLLLSVQTYHSDLGEKKPNQTDYKSVKGLFKYEFNKADLAKAYGVKVLQHTTVCIFLRMQSKVYWS